MSVLIGSNGAGKSNLADAFDFLAEACRSGLDVAVRHRGGVENIWYRKERRSKGELRFEVRVRLHGMPELKRLYLHGFRSPLAFVYSFGCRTTSESVISNVRVTSESMTLQTADESVLFRVWRKDNEVQYEVNREMFQGKASARVFIAERLTALDNLTLESGELLLPFVSRFLPTVRYIVERLGNTKVYQLNPLDSRRPGVMSSSPELERYGGNLPAVLLHLKEKQPRVYEKILEVMRGIMPWLEDITTRYTTDKRLGLYFKERGIGQLWYADEVSDGAIKTLSLLTAVADPRSHLVVLEEPENSVHPWIVKRVYEFCAEIGKRKQLVITTHSPLFLNSLSPGQVFVVSRHDFATNIEALSSLMDNELIQELQLGDYWAAGGFEQALPQFEGGTEE